MTTAVTLAKVASRLVALGLSKRNPSEVAEKAARLLAEAVREGAFSGKEYVELQLAVDDPIPTDLERVQTDWVCYKLAHGNRWIVAWDNAIGLLLPRLEMCKELADLRTFDLGRLGSWVNACGPVAAIIQGFVPEIQSPRLQPSRPVENAFKAYWVRELLNISNQTEIAQKMTEGGVPASQGQVSKWLRQVEEYQKAGGIVPDVEKLNAKPQAMDPGFLDMGPRLDGRTPRQRSRRDPDADSDG